MKRFLSILFCVLFAQITFAQENIIKFDNFSIVGKISYNDIDTISSLFKISDGYEILGCKVSACIRGFYQDAVSSDSKLTLQQRAIIKQMSMQRNFSIENIVIKNTITGETKIYDYIAVSKDGPAAFLHYGHDNDVRLLVKPSYYDYDTSKYTVKSYKIVGANSEYYFDTTIYGNRIDSTLNSEMHKFGKFGTDISITNVVCVENKTGREIKNITFLKDKYQEQPKDEDYHRNFIYRSKNYFLNKNAYIDFIYERKYQIDSVEVFLHKSYNDYYDYNWNEYKYTSADFKFTGEYFPANLKEAIKKTPVFSIVSFQVYHNNECENIPLIINE